MAFTTVPDFLIGEDLTAVTFTPYTKAYGGAITATSAQSLSGYIDAISINPNPNVSNKKSVDTPFGTGTPTFISFTMTITEIQRKPTTSAGPSFLISFANAYSYGLFVFTKGTGADAKTWTAFATWTGTRDGFVDSDVATASIDLTIVDTYSYTMSGEAPLQYGT